MDLDELRAFVAVVDSGSFKSAAAAAGQPRGTLRRRVDALEQRVGVPLLRRSRSGVDTTQAGLRLLRHGRQLLSEAGSLMRTLRALELRKERVRVGLPLGFPPQGLLRMTQFIERSLPQLRLELHFSASPVEDLLPRLDLALDFKLPPPNKHVQSMPLVEFHSGLVASESYLARHGTPHSLHELSAHRLLSWVPADQGGTRWPLVRGGSIPVDPVMSSHDFQLLRQLAADDAGIALLPDTNLPKLDPADRKLVRVLPKQVGGKRRLYLHVNQRQASRPHDFNMVCHHVHTFVSSMIPSKALLTTDLPHSPPPRTAVPSTGASAVF